MNIAEQIAALRHTRTQKAAEMQAVMTKSFEEKRSTSDEERTAFDGLKADIAAIDADLARLEELEKVNKSLALAVPATPAAPNEKKPDPMIEVKSNAKPLEKGEGFGRWARVVAKARGNLLDAERLAKSMYPDDRNLETVIKAAVQAGTTTDSAWAKPLVDVQNYAGDFIEFLRPQTIIGRFGQGGIPGLRQVPFNVRVKGQSSGATAYWVGEGKAKPVTKWGYNDVTLGEHKVATIAVLTDELVRSSAPAADLLARDELASAVVERLDTTFASADAATSASPAGILNGVTAITKSTSTDPFAAMQADVQAVFGAYIAARMAPRQGVWIMSSATALKLAMMRNPLGQAENAGMRMDGGTFVGLPVIVSDYITTPGQIILVNASDVYLASDGGVQLDMSREASIEMNNAPTQDAGAGTGASLVSMFQTNSVALRAEQFMNWDKRRAAAVQTVTNTLWA